MVHGRDVARTEAVAKAIRTDGGRAAVAIGDLATDAGADAVAAAALYLAGPFADYVSGATIRVDGGTIRSVQ